MKRKEILLYFFKVVFIVLTLLTVEFRIQVYTPSILGYIWLGLIPVILGLFFHLIYKDIQSREYKLVVKRTSFFLLFLIIIYVFLTMTEATQI